MLAGVCEATQRERSEVGPAGHDVCLIPGASEGGDDERNYKHDKRHDNQQLDQSEGRVALSASRQRLCELVLH
jgi:hypothetical protein